MRALKISAVAVGALLALLVVALLALPLLVDPNAYKGRLEHAVKEATGRELALFGPIKLSVFPWLALELGPASLGNPPGFGSQPFASLKHAALQVRLLPLLHKRLEFRRIEIDGLELRLARNARGEGNWVLAEPAALSAPDARGGSGHPPGRIQLPALTGLRVTDSRLTYGTLVAAPLNLTVGPVAAGRPIPMDVQLVLTGAPGARPVRLSSRFDLIVSNGTGLSIENLQARLDDSTLRGRAALTSLTTSAMSFDLALDQLDLDRYRAAGSAPAPVPAPEQPSSAPASPMPPATSGATSPELLPVDLLRTLRMDGVLAIGRTKIAGVLLSDLRVGISARDGITRIAPITARLYDGRYSGEAQLDVRGATPVSVLEQTMTGVDTAQLLGDLAHTQRLSGHGTFTSHLTALGDTSDAMLRSLSGHMALNLKDGAIEGIDFRAEINQAMALIGMRAVSQATGGARTKFDTFSMSADITDGVATTRDLNVASHRLWLTGGGTANLVTDALDYRLKAAIVGGTATDAQAPNALVALPLDITGTIANPKVRPDLNAMARGLPVERLQKQGGALLDKLKGLFR